MALSTAGRANIRDIHSGRASSAASRIPGRDSCCQRRRTRDHGADAGVLGKGFVVSQSTSSIRPYEAMSDSQFINAMYLNIGGKSGRPQWNLYWSSQLASAEAQGRALRHRGQGLVGQFVDVLVRLRH